MAMSNPNRQENPVKDMMLSKIELFRNHFSVLFKALKDLKQLDFNDFNFGQAPSTTTDSANILQNLLDSRFYDDANDDDDLSYF